MSSPQKYEDIKRMSPGVRRREAARRYLVAHRGIRDRVVARTDVTLPMVSKVLNGTGKSMKVELALIEEEKLSSQVAA